MRAFIAAPLQPAMSKRLRRLQEGLSAALPTFKPLDLQNLHLTLFFLGDQSSEVLEETAKLMLSIGAEVESFCAPLGGLQLLGGGPHRRPLCLAVSAAPQLHELQRKLNNMVSQLGIVLERRRAPAPG